VVVARREHAAVAGDVEGRGEQSLPRRHEHVGVRPVDRRRELGPDTAQTGSQAAVRRGDRVVARAQREYAGEMVAVSGAETTGADARVADDRRIDDRNGAVEILEMER